MKDGRAGPVPSVSVEAGAVAAETLARPQRAPKASRIVGVDATRGIALVGMMAVHVFADFHRDGTPTAAMAVAGGRAAATFALVAGISLAFMTGGQRPVDGRARAAAAAGIAVRAVLIGGIGLALGSIVADQAVILPYYAVIFLVAIPLLGLRPRVLGSIAVLLCVLVPLFLLVTDLADFPAPDDNPTFGAVLHHPFGRAVQLFITGDYPVLAWMAYICAGLAIGRLNLSSARVAGWLCGGGLALAVSSWFTSSLLLFHLNGLEGLRDAAPQGLSGAQAQNAILWDPNYTSSWWWLAVRAPYTVTPITLLCTLGVAMGVLGGVLLLSRLALAAPALTVLAAAGSMTLTLYSAHLVVLATGLLDGFPSILFVLLVAGALAFAVRWRHRRGQGPLEAIVAFAAGRTRHAVACLPLGERPAASTGDGTPTGR